MPSKTRGPGILERKTHEPRNTTENNLRLTREAIHRVTGETETDATIWHNLRRQAIRPIIQQFLYKTMHGTYMIGKYWRPIPGSEEREICTTCNTTESMNHILTQCREENTQLIWRLAQNLWPHRNTPWPEIDLGIILGCGCINVQPNDREGNNPQQRRKTLQGPT